MYRQNSRELLLKYEKEILVWEKGGELKTVGD